MAEPLGPPPTAGPHGPPDLGELARRIVTVDGVVAVLLGGSRARGDHTSESDTDLGVYYRPPLDVAGLRSVASDLAEPGGEVTEPGAWGPWVDGGAWLRVGGHAVDWIYRDLDRVQRAWSDALAGRYAFHQQVGHPLGFLDVAYAGEVALGVVLADATGEVTALRGLARQYPPALRASLVHVLWEAGFCVRIARKAVVRDDAAYVAGCLFRSVGLCAHALHAHAGRWLLNEKGAVSAAGGLPAAPAGFTVRVRGVFAGLAVPEGLAAAADAAARLVDETAAGVGWPG
jgi:hypothetical protein